jgi:hypothetical protein
VGWHNHLQSEQVEVEGMDMMEVEGTNKVEEHDHPMNHQLGAEGMNMVEEHYHLMNHRLEEEDIVDVRSDHTPKHLLVHGPQTILASLWISRPVKPI